MNLHCKDHPEQKEFYKIIRTRTRVNKDGSHISRSKRRLKEEEKGVKQIIYVCPVDKCDDIIATVPRQEIDRKARWAPLRRG